MDISNSQLSPEMDFMALLEVSFSMEQPERGDLLTGTILAIDNQGMIVDVGMKRDGVVPRSDLERMEGMVFTIGAEIPVMVLQAEDQDGNLIVSVSQARQSEDWIKAEELLEN